MLTTCPKENLEQLQSKELILIKFTDSDSFRKILTQIYLAINTNERDKEIPDETLVEFNFGTKLTGKNFQVFGCKCEKPNSPNGWSFFTPAPKEISINPEDRYCDANYMLASLFASKDIRKAILQEESLTKDILINLIKCPISLDLPYPTLIIEDGTSFDLQQFCQYTARNGWLHPISSQPLQQPGHQKNESLDNFTQLLCRLYPDLFTEHASEIKEAIEKYKPSIDQLEAEINRLKLIRPRIKLTPIIEKALDVFSLLLPLIPIYLVIMLFLNRQNDTGELHKQASATMENFYKTHGTSQAQLRELNKLPPSSLNKTAKALLDLANPIIANTNNLLANGLSTIKFNFNVNLIIIITSTILAFIIIEVSCCLISPNQNLPKKIQAKENLLKYRNIYIKWLINGLNGLEQPLKSQKNPEETLSRRKKSPELSANPSAFHNSATLSANTDEGKKDESNMSENKKNI